MGYLTDLRNKGLEITSRDTWGAVFDYSNPREFVEGRYLFLHIADVPDPDDLIGHEDEVCRYIERIGIGRFPNTGISYNAMVFDTGRLYDGQPLLRRGAHTINDFGVPGFPSNLNYYGHAICLAQRETDTVTDEAVDSIARWGAALVRAGYSKGDQFYPHRKFSPKRCPGDKAMARLDEINDLLTHYINNGLGAEEDDVDFDDRFDLSGAAKQALGLDSMSLAGALSYGAMSKATLETVLARIGALEGIMTEVLNSSKRTIPAEELVAAARAGAEQALEAGFTFTGELAPTDEVAPA